MSGSPAQELAAVLTTLSQIESDVESAEGQLVNLQSQQVSGVTNGVTTTITDVLDELGNAVNQVESLKQTLVNVVVQVAASGSASADADSGGTNGTGSGPASIEGELGQAFGALSQVVTDIDQAEQQLVNFLTQDVDQAPGTLNTVVNNVLSQLGNAIGQIETVKDELFGIEVAFTGSGSASASGSGSTSGSGSGSTSGSGSGSTSSSTSGSGSGSSSGSTSGSTSGSGSGSTSGSGSGSTSGFIRGSGSGSGSTSAFGDNNNDRDDIPRPGRRLGQLFAHHHHGEMGRD